MNNELSEMYTKIFVQLEERILSVQELRDCIQPLIVQFWKDGRLPLKVSQHKYFIVGFRIAHQRFGTSSIQVITRGPKPPSRFRSQFGSYEFRNFMSNDTQYLPKK